MSKIAIYDTTLRDGSQTEGISFSVNDKIKIAEKLDQLGVHYIEGGWPGSNPKAVDFFREMKNIRLKQARLSAFGSTRRARISVEQDDNIQALIEAETPTVAIFGKSWDLHVTKALRISLEENLKMIAESVAYLKKRGREVIYDAEHFFDGYQNNPDYALKTITAAIESGADTIALCDTNGGTLPMVLEKIVHDVIRQFSDVSIGVHLHNDAGVAVANSLLAVMAGANHIQGTFNGIGERCGNANLITIIGILQLKMEYKLIPPKKLRELTEVSRFVSEISNMAHQDNQPFVGKSAFAHLQDITGKIQIYLKFEI